MALQLTVNGERRSVDVDPDTPLLWVLRDELKLTGTKYGCGVAQCGACTVRLGRQPVRSCVVPISSVGRREVTTVEGLTGNKADAVRAAWEEIQVPQCGYCQTGQIMTAVALVERIADPTDDDVDAAMNGNVCRCATYVRIREAIHRAARGGSGGKGARS